jgi:eukaryotic-like serine/threonine-protein kinase
MVGELIAGRYELQELVGAGGMSNVFRAYDRLLERTVAIKVLHEQLGADDDYVERFRREARSVAQLTHPNIVTVIDRGEEDGRQYIVFEYIEGDSLKQVVADGPLPIGDTLELALQVAEALAFAHDRGLVHRDVKPQNVLLTEEGRAKVTDFGIARSLDVQGVTQTGTVLGTSDYIAPEQARGQPVDRKTDIYSLGAVLYELLTGDVPYSGDNFVAVAMQHVHQPVPSVLERRPDVPLRLDFAVQRAMAKDPDDRFDSMHEFVHELQACGAEAGSGPGEGATMVVPARVARARRQRRAPRLRIPMLPVLLGIAAVAATAIGLTLLLRDTPVTEVLPENPVSTPAVKLTSVASYDPDGDGQEHDDDVRAATDGNRSTEWTTENYRDFTKPGVGLVLDAGRPAELSRVVIESGEGGFEAQIKASTRRDGDFVEVSDFENVGAAASILEVDTEGRSYRYYLVWIRLPADGGRAQITEIRT